MPKEQVLIVLPVRDELRDTFRQAAPEAEIRYIPAAEVTEADVKAANVIIGNVRPEWIRDSSELRWIQLNSAGTEGFRGDAVPAGAVLTNATGCYGLAISEHLIAMMFALQKRLDLYAKEQEAHRWQAHEPMWTAEESVVLVLGLGDIGSTFARKVKAMGSYVIGVRRHDIPKPDYVDEQYSMDALHELLPRADVVAMSLPGYEGTMGLIGAEELALMKETAILLNIGRGTAVDSDALNEALRSGKIYGAGIDVTDPEPLPADHPLWDAPHTIITPHVSGGFALPVTLEKILRLSAENLGRFERGEQLVNIIDPETGYVKR